MSLIGRIRKRVRAAAARSRLERDMQEEMRGHIAQAAERFRSRGMSEADALVAARREFGNVGVLQEQARDARGARWIESVLGDLRHALRQYARSPLLAATIVLTLTLGIGVSSAAFSLIAGAVSRPTPGIPADPSLVTIRGIGVNDGRAYARNVSYPELMDVAGLSEFREVAGWVSSLAVVEADGKDVEMARVQYVTPNLFRTLGVSLIAGPGFVQRDMREHDSPEMSAVVSRSFAVAEFGVVENAIGKTMRVNGANVRIVGVAPPRFVGAFHEGGHRMLWMPLSAWPVLERLDGDAFTSRRVSEFRMVARLRDGVSTDEASKPVKLVAQRAKEAAGYDGPSRMWRNATFGADVVRLRANAEYKPSKADDYMMIAMVVVCALLIVLVCTTTVSSLLVGAAVSRRHEIAVRLALGASRLRIMRQLLTENFLLSAMAAAAGLATFAVISRSLRDQIRDVNLDPSWMTAVATAGFAVVIALLCGLSPALHATKEDLAGVMKDSSTNSTVKTRLQRVFVVAQIALTQPLLLGLAVAVAVVLREGGHGMKASLNERVVLANFDAWSPTARANYQLPQVAERIRALPGVLAVLPQESGWRIMKIELPATGTQVKVRTEQLAPGYFKAMGIQLVRGREFVPTDTTFRVSPVVIGSDFATKAFGEADPIGKRLKTYTFAGRPDTEVEVVGVVAAADVGSSEYGSSMRIFSPNGGAVSTRLKPNALIIRTSSLAEPMIATFRKIARAEAPLMPLSEIQTLAQIEAYRRSEVVEAASAAAVGGTIALFLASIGLYAVVALGVGQRRREIGVRVSLGARPSQVVALFFRGGLRVSLLGVGIGLPLSAAVIAIVGSQVGMPRANMPVIGAAVALVVVVVASLASWIPARRAAGVDPLIALRDG
jgi:predicted permease